MAFGKDGKSAIRSCSGEIRNLQRRNEWIYDVEIWLLNDKVNRNNWKYVNLEQHKDAFAGTPILIAYINNGNGIGDGHNFKMKRDPKTGEKRPSFTDANAERIVGALSENPNDMRLEFRDGYTWIVGKGFLWAWYAPELVDKIANDAMQGRSMSISIETLVSESHMEGNIEVEEKYTILGTTILGDHVMPAVADARVVALQSIGSEFKELKMRAASYQDKPSAQHPHKNNSQKGVKKLDVFNETRLQALATRFNGYSVLGAAQSETGIHVCLMNAEGKLFSYTMADENETIATERINAAFANTVFGFGEAGNVELDAGKMLAEMQTRLSAAETKCNNATADLDKANKTIEAMREAENSRRVNAVKEKAKNVLAEFNACRESKLEDSLIDSVNADIDSGLYTNCVNADGAWVGEKKVSDAVLALCAAEVMAADKKAAAANQTVFVWNQIKKDHADDGSIESQLKAWGIE